MLQAIYIQRDTHDHHANVQHTSQCTSLVHTLSAPHSYITYHTHENTDIHTHTPSHPPATAEQEAVRELCLKCHFSLVLANFKAATLSFLLPLPNPRMASDLESWPGAEHSQDQPPSERRGSREMRGKYKKGKERERKTESERERE